MRRTILTLLSSLLLMTWFGNAQSNSHEVESSEQGTREAVKELYLSSIEAFNARNLDLFLSNFSSDIKMYGTDGMYEGQEALRARFQGIFQRFPNTKMTIPQITLDVLSQEAVLVHFNWKVYPMGEGPAYSGKGSGLYVKREGNWVEVLEAETITEVDDALKPNR